MPLFHNLNVVSDLITQRITILLPCSNMKKENDYSSSPNACVGDLATLSATRSLDFRHKHSGMTKHCSLWDSCEFDLFS